MIHIYLGNKIFSLLWKACLMNYISKCCVTFVVSGCALFSPNVNRLKRKRLSSSRALTHWGRDQIDAMSQTIFSHAFSRMKMNEFRLKFHWFVPKGPINNIPALVQIMAWRRSGDKPLSEPVMVSLPTHICATRPQWVKGCVSELSSNTVAQNSCFLPSSTKLRALLNIKMSSYLYKDSH